LTTERLGLNSLLPGYCTGVDSNVKIDALSEKRENLTEISIVPYRQASSRKAKTAQTTNVLILNENSKLDNLLLGRFTAVEVPRGEVKENLICELR
jgi:hypothetical protein